MESIPLMDMRRDKKLELFPHASEPTVAIGIGCKRGCSSEAIAAFVERAVAAASCAGAPAALFTHEAEKSEAGLANAATALFAASLFTRRHELAKSDGDVRTSFHRGGRRARRRGTVSVLLVARMSGGGASCAIAGKKEP